MGAWSCGQLPVGRSYKFPMERMIASTRGNTALRLQLTNLQQQLFLSTALLASRPSTNCLNYLSGFHASPSDASLQWRPVLQTVTTSATVGLYTSTDSPLIPRNASTLTFAISNALTILSQPPQHAPNIIHRGLSWEASMLAH
jgi:hypothetical protein